MWNILWITICYREDTQKQKHMFRHWAYNTFFLFAFPDELTSLQTMIQKISSSVELSHPLWGDKSKKQGGLITKREVVLVYHWRRKLIVPCKTWQVLRDLSARQERWRKAKESLRTANPKNRLRLGHNSLSCNQSRRNVCCPLFLA